MEIHDLKRRLASLFAVAFSSLTPFSQLYSAKELEEEESANSTPEGKERKKSGKGLHRNIIEAGKCFGYQCFVTKDSERRAIAYRAFSACSIMQLTERALKAIIERHPVLRDKLNSALKDAIQRQTASDDVLTNQVHRLQKKNSLFHALQINLMNSDKRANLANALNRGETVKKVIADENELKKVAEAKWALKEENDEAEGDGCEGKEEEKMKVEEV